MRMRILRLGWMGDDVSVSVLGVGGGWRCYVMLRAGT